MELTPEQISGRLTPNAPSRDYWSPSETLSMVTQRKMASWEGHFHEKKH